MDLTKVLCSVGIDLAVLQDNVVNRAQEYNGKELDIIPLEEMHKHAEDMYLEDNTLHIEGTFEGIYWTKERRLPRPMWLEHYVPVTFVLRYDATTEEATLDIEA